MSLLNGFKLLLILSFILLLSYNSFALDNRTAWNGWHVMGSDLGVVYLNHAGYSWWKSASIMFLSGIAWEMMDEISYQAQWKNDLWDYRRGFELSDIGLNFIGITLSIPIRK